MSTATRTIVNVAAMSAPALSKVVCIRQARARCCPPLCLVPSISRLRRTAQATSVCWYSKSTGTESSPQRHCAVFWDYDMTSLYDTFSEIREIAQKQGTIKTFNVYTESTTASAKLSELQVYGLSLVVCPNSELKDKIMSVDMLLKYTNDNPPPGTIALVSRNEDLACALGSLRMRGYRILVIGRESVSQGLAAQADDVHVLQAPGGISRKEAEPEEVVDGKEVQTAKRSRKKKEMEKEKEKAAVAQPRVPPSLVKKAFSIVIASLIRGRWF